MVFDKVKHWLGIEGIKMELLLPPEISTKSSLLEGKIRFVTRSPQVVKEVEIALIERYTRGKGADKRTDEYELGRIRHTCHLSVAPENALEVPFGVPFVLLQSRMDAFGERNRVYRGIANAAKGLQGVQSVFRVEAKAVVEGVKLQPFDEKFIVFT